MEFGIDVGELVSLCFGIVIGGVFTWAWFMRKKRIKEDEWKMNLKEFQELPIGTVLEYWGITHILIEVKISKNCTIIVYDEDFNDWNLIGDIQNYKVRFGYALYYLRIADKHIADYFKVIGE